MSGNYNLGSNFGLNISKTSIKKEENQKLNSSSKDVNNLFDSMINYVDKYENVFNGEVEKEISIYSRQAMFVGMNLKSSDTKHNFDMNI